MTEAYREYMRQLKSTKDAKEVPMPDINLIDGMTKDEQKMAKNEHLRLAEWWMRRASLFEKALGR